MSLHRLTLVLNAGYEPVNIVSARRAITPDFHPGSRRRKAVCLSPKAAPESCYPCNNRKADRTPV